MAGQVVRERIGDVARSGGERIPLGVVLQGIGDLSLSVVQLRHELAREVAFLSVRRLERSLPLDACVTGNRWRIAGTVLDRAESQVADLLLHGVGGLGNHCLIDLVGHVGGDLHAGLSDALHVSTVLLHLLAMQCGQAEVAGAGVRMDRLGDGGIYKVWGKVRDSHVSSQKSGGDHQLDWEGPRLGGLPGFGLRRPVDDRAGRQPFVNVGFAPADGIRPQADGRRKLSIAGEAPALDTGKAGAGLHLRFTKNDHCSYLFNAVDGSYERTMSHGIYLSH